MDLKSQFDTQIEWENYRNEIRRAFRKIGVEHRTIKEVQVIINKIDWRFRMISNEKIYLRQDRKVELHMEKIEKYHREVHELVDVLNENFVLEILLGD